MWWALLPLGGLGGTGLEQGLQGWRGVVAEGEEWGLQPCHQAAWVRILAACPWLLALSVPLWRCLDKLIRARVILGAKGAPVKVSPSVCSVK